MEFGRTRKTKLQISMIPLINVIFLLLIFFMVAGSIEGVDIFEVTLPKAKNSQIKPNIPNTLYISSDGKIAVNNDVVAKKDLKTILSTLYIDNPDQLLKIKSDLNVLAEQLIFVLNVIEEVGGVDVSLVIQVDSK